MKLKNKNIFITGVSGSVGSHMAKYFLNEEKGNVGVYAGLRLEEALNDDETVQLFH